MTVSITLTFANAVEAAAAIAKLNGESNTGSTPAPKKAAAEPKEEAVEKPAVKKAAPKAVEPAHTRDEMKAALTKVKDTIGVEQAKAIISEVGGVAAMKDIPDDKIDAVYVAATAELEEASM